MRARRALSVCRPAASIWAAACSVNACVEACPRRRALQSDPRMGATKRDDLTVRGDAAEARASGASSAFSRLFGRSLKMRQVSAGGCNACELELNAAHQRQLRCAAVRDRVGGFPAARGCAGPGVRSRAT